MVIEIAERRHFSASSMFSAPFHLVASPMTGLIHPPRTGTARTQKVEREKPFLQLHFRHTNHRQLSMTEERPLMRSRVPAMHHTWLARTGAKRCHHFLSLDPSRISAVNIIVEL